MKKIALSAAVAAAISMSVQAVEVRSQIDGMQLWVGDYNPLPDPLAHEAGAGYHRDIAIAGDTETGLTFTGIVVFNAGLDVRLNFNLSSGLRQGVNGAGGVLFSGGTIVIDTNDGSGWATYATVDASTQPLSFLAGVDTHLTSCAGEGICTSGLVVYDQEVGVGGSPEERRTIAILPGLWSGDTIGAGRQELGREASGVSLFGNAAGVFLEGRLYAVPLPAAGWLFGASLIALSARKIRRR